MQAEDTQAFLPLHQAATRLGVPAAWLRAEAKAGRVPCLMAGRRLLFHMGVAEQALIQQAEHNATIPRRENAEE